MNRWTIAAALLATLLLGLVAGALLAPGSHSQMSATGGSGPCAGGAEPDYWVAPMDSNYRRDGPGKSPMGMDLVPVCAQDKDAAADLQISAGVRQQLGVRTVVVEPEVLKTHLRVPGRVALADDQVQRIHARTAGWIEELGVSAAGESVTPGVMLYRLFAPELATAISDYRFAAQRKLGDVREAAAQRLLTLGLQPAQIRELTASPDDTPHVAHRATTTAQVLTVPVRQGEYVLPGTTLMTLAQLDPVWVWLDVLERDSQAIEIGLPVTLHSPAVPGQEWSGQIDSIAPALDPMTRTLAVRVTLANSAQRLRPGMLLRASIQTTAEPAVLSLPRDAVIQDGRGARVALALGEGQFRIIPVQIGRQTADRIEILDGLQAGDRVVRDGLFLIDAEANVDLEARRLQHEHPGEAMQHEHPGKAMQHEHPGKAMQHEHPGEDMESRGHSDWVAATIIDLSPQSGAVLLDHGPIPAVGMGAMTMSFSVHTDIPLDAFAPGDRVRFQVSTRAADNWRILALEPAP